MTPHCTLRPLSRFNLDSNATKRHQYAIMPRLVILLTAILWSITTPWSYAQLPVDPAVVHGSAVVDTVGAHMTVTNSPNAIINWQEFSIGANHGVHFQQQDAASQVLNRVIGNDPSQLLGSLSSNGGVWLINPHGVLFGPDARIDVGGLVASTLDISNLDFLANRYNFNAIGDIAGDVVNQGEIRTTFGGRVWLVGGQVHNEGLIQAPGGNVVLAAGKSVELVDSGAPNVAVRVNAPENKAVNLGTLVADNGNVDVHGSIVNQEGIIRAGSVTTDASGNIVLKASQALTLAENSQTEAGSGTVRLEADTLNSRGEISGNEIALAANQILQQGKITAPGGDVTLAAETSTYLDGEVDVSSQQGAGGNIQLNTGKLEGIAGGKLRADGEQGGHIRVEGRDSVALSSTLEATGTTQGGKIEVTGDSVALLNANIDASGGTQGGTVHLGGGWQGGGDLPHAREVIVGVGSEVKANGNTGGGEIAVWSTQSSGLYGSLLAKDGGRIELSSKGVIRHFGDIVAGPGGSVLFDPKDIYIIGKPGEEFPDTDVNNNNEKDEIQIQQPIDATFGENEDGVSYILGNNLEGIFTAGTEDVTLQATNDIFVRDEFKFSGANLNLQAGHDITFNDRVEIDSGNLTAEATNDIFVQSEIITFSDGDLNLQAGHDITFNAGTTTDGNLTAQAGNDIFVQSEINAFSGALQAGHDITFSANVNIFGSNLTAIAGDSNADPSAIDFVIPTITIENGVELDVDDTAATLAAVNGNFINNNGDLAITTGSGHWRIYAADPDTSVEGFSRLDPPGQPNFKRNYGVSLGTPLSDAQQQGNWFFYSRVPTLKVAPSNVETTYGNATGDTTLSIAGSIDFSDLLLDDTVDEASVTGNATWRSVAGAAVSSSGNLTAGVHDVSYVDGLVSDLGYQLVDDPASTNELTVNAKPITVSVSAQNKEYDGTTLAGVSGTFSDDVFQGDSVSFSGTGSFGDKNVGAIKPVTLVDAALVGLDSSNYVIANNPTVTADITPRSLILNELTAQDKVYDGTADAILNATLIGLIDGDSVSIPDTGAFDNKNVGNDKPVTLIGELLSGPDSSNYAITDVPKITADITPKKLTAGNFVALDKVFDNTIKASLVDGSGSLFGLIEGDSVSLSGATGAFENKNVGDNKPVGITNAALVGPDSSNYTLNDNDIVAAAADITPALDQPSPLQALEQPSPLQALEQTLVRNMIPVVDGTKPVLDDFTTGRVIDMTSSMIPNFGRLNLARMSREDMQQLIIHRKNFKEKLFADAIYKLELDPRLADVRLCSTLTEIDSGLCRISSSQRSEYKSNAIQDQSHKGKRNERMVSIPQIERKFVVLFGIDQYTDKSIPPLLNTISDAKAIGKLFADDMGYEVRVVKNATRADLIRTLNQLSIEMEVSDSVVIYYAGHGYSNEKTGSGYWIPGDASAKDPASWISNSSISEMLSVISSKQMVMISDSCYSGTFAKEHKFEPSGVDTKLVDILAKRSVVVMSSGGDEPVADEGRDGHSIFAWYLMQSLRDINSWKLGNNIFEQIKHGVRNSFPQTPQYGAAISAGHEIGGDYLYEYRELGMR